MSFGSLPRQERERRKLCQELTNELVFQRHREIYAQEQGRHWEAKRPEIEAMGFRMVSIVLEENGVREYLNGGFRGDVLLDPEAVFFKAVGGGDFHYEYLVNTRYIMGGCIVVKDGEVRYHYLESLFGGFVPLDLEVMPLVRHLAGRQCS